MGSAWMLVAGLCFALMSVVVKSLGQAFSSAELVFYRSLFGLVAIFLVLAARGDGVAWRGLRGAHVGLHVRRGLVGFAALATFFHALIHLPMSVAVTLNYASPLFLALLMPWQLRERPGVRQYLAVAAGFLGVVLLLRPWEGGLEVLAGLAGLGSGLLAAFAYPHVRRLGKLGEPEWRTVFWFTLVSGLGAAGLASVQGWHPLSGDNLPLLLAMGLTATLGQLAMSRAYRRGDTVVVGALAYSTVVFGSLLDVIIWRHGLPFLAWLGMALTVTAGLWAIRTHPKEP